MSGFIYTGEDREARNRGLLNLGEWKISSTVINTRLGMDGHAEVEWARGKKYLRSNGR